LLKSIALAQIHWISLAQFLRYYLDDSSGCNMQGANPSWSAFHKRHYRKDAVVRVEREEAIEVRRRGGSRAVSVAQDGTRCPTPPIAWAIISKLL
jgi:hypothetical protein